MPKSIDSGHAGKSKPQKPYAGFPLFPHQTGRWAKKVRGSLKYFGKIEDDPAGEKALEKWESERDDLMRGRKPRKTGGVNVADVCNAFLNAKLALLNAKTPEITRRTFGEYHLTTDRIIEAFGSKRSVDDLRPEDFEELRTTLSKTRGPTALGNEITRVKMVFKHAWDNSIIEKPVRYGTSFTKPSAKVLRKNRASAGSRMIEAADLRTIIKAAPSPMDAFVLLGLNAGFGAQDLAELPLAAVDLKSGFVSFARPKTGEERRCPLWAETVASLRTAIGNRPAPRDPADDPLLFLTDRGRRWVRGVVTDDPKKWNTRQDLIGRHFSALIDECGLKQKGRAFYSLRHIFRTIADEVRDPPAVQRIMGHAPQASDMGAVYREYISDDRLRAVADHVRRWLFASAVG